MLTFEGVKQRLERGLSFIEFNYQLLQSYDFYMLNKNTGCRLQMGGADQWGNIVAGIDLICRMDGPQCYGLTFNLIMRSDGKKMGKSEKGAVFLNPRMYSPYDFFQYWRNVTDDDVIRFMKIFTFLSLEEIAEYADPQRNINDAKERLAYEQTKIVHGEEEAEKALSAARAMFSGSGAAADREGMPSIEIPLTSLEDGIGVLSLFSMTDLCATNSDARRLVTQGGAMVNDRKVEDPKAVIDASWLDDHGEMVLKAGKKRYFRVVAK
jgi:tyrosyl-tRNA synthetase